MNSNQDIVKLSALLTNHLTVTVKDLQKNYPEKDFSLIVYEPNLYWCINWKSTKLWKTDKFLKESFVLRMFQNNEKCSLEGYHRIEDIFEQLEDTHFRYEEKTVLQIVDQINFILSQTKDAVIKSVNQEFDPNF